MKVYLFECVDPYEQRLVFATYPQAVDHFISFITNSPENFDEDDREMLAWVELQAGKRWQDYLKEDLPLKDFNEAFCELATITEFEVITN